MMQSTCFLDKNLETLRKYPTPLVEWLTTQNIGSEMRFVTNRWGSLDWPLPTGKGLFEAIPPHVYYENWIPKEKVETSATVIVGCNLGYGLNHVLAHTPNTHKVFVIEPRAEILIACLAQTDYSRVFEIHRLFLLPPDLNYVRRMIFRQLGLQHEFGNIFFRVDIPSQQLGAEYAVWVQHCSDALSDFKVEMNTLRTSQDTMVKNELNNFARAMKDGSTSRLENQAKGLSAVILGAGPSLTDFAPQLAENQRENPGQALYASALQSLPVLQQYDLKPLFCLAIDFTENLKKVYNRLDKKWAKKVPLVYSCKVAPEVIDAYPGPTLPIWTSGGIGTHLWKGRECVLDSGRNAGIALTRLLNWCGVSRILLVGFDFAWSGETTHAVGHLASENKFQYDPRHHIQIRNRKGQIIYSAPAFISALRRLETVLKEIKAKTFNLYGGNAVINGAQEVTWDDVLSCGILRSPAGTLTSFTNKLWNKPSPTPWPLFEARSSWWTDSLRSAQKRLEKLFKRANHDKNEIHTALNHLLFFLNQDPLYQPYLLNEVRSLNGLVFVKNSYTLNDLADCKKIIKRALSKVREMDQKLAAQAG